MDNNYSRNKSNIKERINNNIDEMTNRNKTSLGVSFTQKNEIFDQLY